MTPPQLSMLTTSNISVDGPKPRRYQPCPILLRPGWIFIIFNDFFFWKFSIYPSITSGSDIVFSEIWLWKYEFRFPKRCILAPNTVLISFLVLIFENFILRNRFRKRWYIDRDIDQYFEGPTKKLTSEFYENADLSLLEVRNGQKFKSLDSIEFLQS